MYLLCIFQVIFWQCLQSSLLLFGIFIRVTFIKHLLAETAHAIWLHARLGALSAPGLTVFCILSIINVLEVVDFFDHTMLCEFLWSILIISWRKWSVSKIFFRTLLFFWLIQDSLSHSCSIWATQRVIAFWKSLFLKFLMEVGLPIFLNVNDLLRQILVTITQVSNTQLT